MSRLNLAKQLIQKGDEIHSSLVDVTKQEAKVQPFGGVNDPEKTDIYRLKHADYLRPDPKYRYKSKTLLLANRGVSALARLLLKDLKLLLPHNKAESKLEKKAGYNQINQLAELSSCNSVIFIESKKLETLFWLALTPHGPTLKCRITNIHTLRDSTFFGNCLLYSRPLLIFDGSFSVSEAPAHLRLIQVLLSRIFATPNHHPKSKPFVDHCLSFIYLDGRIFVRHYQIAPIGEAGFGKPSQQQLTEIGPQFVLEPILLLQGSFGGVTLWRNSKYLSPAALLKHKKQLEAAKVLKRLKQKQKRDEKDTVVIDGEEEARRVFLGVDDEDTESDAQDE